MKNHPNPYDPKGVLSINYSGLLAGHFHMRKHYHIRRPAGTNDWLVILTLQGKGTFRHKEGELVTTTGDIILLRPQTPHDYGIETTLQFWELLWAHFHPPSTWNILLDWPEVAPGLMHLRMKKSRTVQSVSEKLEEAYRLSLSSLSRREWLAMNALEGALLWCDTVNPRSHPPELDARLQATVEYINQNLSAPLFMETLTEVSQLSVSRLSYLFRAQMNTTPQRFIESQRMDRAKRLLQVSQIPIANVAAEVGFADPFYFSQRFRRHAGMSPRQYRDKANP